MSVIDGFVIAPKPAVHFGVGAVAQLPALVRATGADQVVVVTDPQRGRDLDHRGDFAVPALPIVAVPTTAGPGAETSALGAVTDPASHRTFYAGHASSMPAAVILDPALTVDLPPGVTAATGTDLAARSQLLLAAHMAGVAMASTGLGLCHAIAHSLSARWNITHGVALAMLLPGTLRFNLPVRTERMAGVALAFGAGSPRPPAADDIRAILRGG